MTPAERRAILAAAMESAGLTATQTAWLLGMADDYGAALIDDCAKTPRSQQDSLRRPA